MRRTRGVRLLDFRKFFETFMARPSAPPLALSAATAAGSRAVPAAPTTQAPAVTTEGDVKEICMLYLREAQATVLANLPSLVLV